MLQQALCSTAQEQLSLHLIDRPKPKPKLMKYKLLALSVKHDMILYFFSNHMILYIKMLMFYPRTYF
jgi:hypothetical protein